MDWPRDLPPAWTASCDVRVFEVARASYETAGRHYHAWGHVEDCLGKLRKFPCERPREVFLALLFHDAVYVAGRNDNEERSAELASVTLAERSRVPETERAAIHRMILATKDHQPREGASAGMRAVLDIDMSILGAEPAEYLRYTRDVEREWVPSVTTERRFRIGRVAFLEERAASRLARG